MGLSDTRHMYLMSSYPTWSPPVAFGLDIELKESTPSYVDTINTIKSKELSLEKNNNVSRNRSMQ